MKYNIKYTVHHLIEKPKLGALYFDFDRIH